ncbi:MAG: divergent polysaccharide deacetylase family protein [Candidatus Omnitrophica bacterium]|nr:divergent polysaccharide deacetylase family protein [Candidatus Omnitrophota bacterium]
MSYLRRSAGEKIDKRIISLFFIAGILTGALITLLLYKIYMPTERKVVDHQKAAPPERAYSKIAIVLDDFGYNSKNVEAVFNLKRPVTFSILPHLPYSKAISTHAHRRGFETILHLPLEPYREQRPIRPEANTITVDMETEEVKERLAKAIDSVPHIMGISSHQGSKATEDATLMKTIFMDLKERKLFFLDSLVSNKSVCKRVARKAGLRFNQRDIFLDNMEDFEYIKGQMEQLIRKAKAKGSAIGIGHDRKNTILALSKLMPEAQERGIEFVFLSELIK